MSISIIRKKWYIVKKNVLFCVCCVPDVFATGGPSEEVYNPLKNIS